MGGEELKRFLDEEIALVKDIDPTRPIIITETGEFSASIQAENCTYNYLLILTTLIVLPVSVSLGVSPET